MYIPKINLTTDTEEIISFMRQFSFATIITAKNGLPTASHLPFLISKREETIVLTAHFARANDHWEQIETNQVLVIFSQPHAYISPQNYDKELNVPTWNYISIHAYGKGVLIMEPNKTLEILEATINNYEPSYKVQWDKSPEDFKTKMIKGIVAVEITVTELQAKKKLSQNRSELEQKRIIDSLSKSSDSNEQLIAQYMQKQLTVS